MKKEDYSSISTQLLQDKFRRAQRASWLFTGAMVVAMLIILTFMLLGETQGGFAGFVAMFTPFAVYYGQKAKDIKLELSKRAKG